MAYLMAFWFHAAEARQPKEYEGVNERTRDFLKAHKPKWLEGAKAKFNKPQSEEAEAKMQVLVCGTRAPTLGLDQR